MRDSKKESTAVPRNLDFYVPIGTWAGPGDGSSGTDTKWEKLPSRLDFELEGSLGASATVVDDERQRKTMPLLLIHLPLCHHMKAETLQ